MADFDTFNTNEVVSMLEAKATLSSEARKKYEQYFNDKIDIQIECQNIELETKRAVADIQLARAHLMSDISTEFAVNVDAIGQDLKDMGMSDEQVTMVQKKIREDRLSKALERTPNALKLVQSWGFCK